MIIIDSSHPDATEPFFFVPSFTNAQTLDQSVLLSTGTIQTAPTASELQAELVEINQEIAYLERLLSIYEYYGIEGDAKDVLITEYEKADQKASQLINLLSSVMKTMSDMSSAVIRNLR